MSVKVQIGDSWVDVGPGEVLLFDFPLHTITVADIALLEMCATRGVNYLTDYSTDEEEDVE